MRIALISAVFPPEPVTSAMTSSELAADLVQQGHHVTVITCFPSRPFGRFYPRAPLALWRRVNCSSSFELHRVISIPSGNSGGFLWRILECLSFALSTAIALITITPDVIVVNSWPIFGNGLIVLLGRLRNIPVVVSIQDIHPEAVVAAGKMNESSFLVRWLQYWDGVVARNASALVVISERFKRFYVSRRNVATDRIHVIYNWMNESEIVPQERDGAFRARMGLSPEQFVVMYAGTVGALTGAATLIDVAEKLKDQSDIVFLIAGSGSDIERCRAAVAERSLSNVRFHSPWVDEPAAEVHAAADVLVLLKSKGGSLTSVPSKLIGYMLSGRPVIATVEQDSDTAAVLAESASGVCVPPEDPDALAGAILSLRESSAKRAALARRGREYAVANFSRVSCLPRLRTLVQTLGAKRAAKRDRPRRALMSTWILALVALIMISLVPHPADIVESVLFHTLAYAGVACLAIASFGIGPRGLAWSLVLFPCGLLLELAHLFVPGRTFQWSVIAAASFGIGVGLAASVALEFSRARRARI